MTKYAGRGATVDLDGTPIGQLTAFGEVGSTRDLIDASVYGEDFKDWVGGMQDGSEISLTIAYDPIDAGAQALITAYNDTPDTPVTFTLAHADAGLSIDATAKLTKLGYAADLGGLLQLNVTAKVVSPGVVVGS